MGIFDLTTTNETKYAIRTLALSQTSNDLLIGGRTGQVEVWNAESGERTLTTTGHTGTVVGVAFSPDGRAVATRLRSCGTPRRVANN